MSISELEAEAQTYFYRAVARAADDETADIVAHSMSAARFVRDGRVDQAGIDSWIARFLPGTSSRSGARRSQAEAELDKRYPDRERPTHADAAPAGAARRRDLTDDHVAQQADRQAKVERAKAELARRYPSTTT